MSFLLVVVYGVLTIGHMKQPVAILGMDPRKMVTVICSILVQKLESKMTFFHLSDGNLQEMEWKITNILSSLKIITDKIM